MSKPKSHRNISIVGPTKLTGIKLTDPPKYAAGLPAVMVALNHAMKEMGLAKSVATLSKLNQKGGIDCPGCAWPDPENRSSVGEFCENGVKAVSEEATNKRVGADFFRKYSVEDMSNWTDFEIGKSGRLTEPMILKPGNIHYEPISWNEAFKVIAGHLQNLDDPDDAVFYTSGRSSNEAAFLYGLFIRAFGTNNMPDCSNMCHESSGAALGQSLGIGKGSVTLDDFSEAEVVIIMGQNPGTNHPRMLSALEKCKANGGVVVTINPLEEVALSRFKNPQKVKGLVGSGSAITDLFLQVKVNQDVPLLKLIMKKLLTIEEEHGGVFDKDFIQNKTDGFENLIDDLSKYDEGDLLLRTGISNERIDQLVNLLTKKKKIIFCWAMGLTQHKNGVDNIKEIVNLLLLKGSIGKSGSGTCPVRGHSNVQGDRTVGIMHHVSPRLNKSIKKVFGFDPPEKTGLDTVKSIEQCMKERSKCLLH